jgi:tetratricopeptide (TPR) repeat protein
MRMMCSCVVVMAMVLAARSSSNGTAAPAAGQLASAGSCNFAALNQEIRANSRNVNALITRAACNLNSSRPPYKPPLQNVELAVADLEAALRLEPQNYYALHNYAQAAYLLGFDQYAATEYTKAIEVNPHGARSYLGRGWAYANLCQLKNMNEDFGQAVRLDHSLQREVASAQQVSQAERSCARPAPGTAQNHNCPKAYLNAFSMNARLVLQAEWQARHPGCPLL